MGVVVIALIMACEQWVSSMSVSRFRIHIANSDIYNLVCVKG